MKIQFDPNQQYQLDAIQSVVDVFEGFPSDQLTAGTGILRALYGETEGADQQISDLIADEDFLENTRKVQASNGIEPVEELHGRNFSVEMETGTGKTYTYLRTIHELRQKYGFTKFVIVVPSVAIREGVMKTLRITEAHFKGLYNNLPFDYWEYDSKRFTELRHFALSNDLQILVINIDSFNKKANNVIHQEQDGMNGHRPIEFIWSANPIVIMDEPQNMETDNQKAAIASLNPFCTLRYSATHRNVYNPIYRLDPVKAHDMHLVKHIEVYSVIEDSDFNQAFVALESLTPGKTKITAKLMINVQDQDGNKRKAVTINKQGMDLFDLSGGHPAYRGYIVDNMDVRDGTLAFTNGVVVTLGADTSSHHDDVMKAQIRQTILEHLRHELYLRKKRKPGEQLKVLSLLFIDRVANYAPAGGKIRRWFEEAYQELAVQPRFSELNLPSVKKVHNGYFAQDKKGVAKDTNGESVADQDVYELIMRDKERLLSIDEPLRFIFSHSALREGWDNPNVFQICTLNESVSDMKKRQEIGRGLRLPVDQTGNRVFDDDVNRLLVVANESYEVFAKTLQNEIREDFGIEFGKRVRNNRARRTVNMSPKLRDNQEFLELWKRIKYKTKYSVDYDTNELIREAQERISKMPLVEPTKIKLEQAKINVKSTGLETSILASGGGEVLQSNAPIPDLIGHIQRKTELTRKTIADILVGSNRIGEVFINPQLFLDRVTKEIQATLRSFMVRGIKYERVMDDAGKDREFTMFRVSEDESEGFAQMFESFADRLEDVGKSVYESIEFDSDTEADFARELNTRVDVKFFMKLPRWFVIGTPLGKYNPDWAVVKEDMDGDKRLYLIAETKGTLDHDELRPVESGKIACGKVHFEMLGVDYKESTVKDHKIVGL